MVFYSFHRVHMVHFDYLIFGYCGLHSISIPLLYREALPILLLRLLKDHGVSLVRFSDRIVERTPMSLFQLDLLEKAVIKLLLLIDSLIFLTLLKSSQLLNPLLQGNYSLSLSLYLVLELATLASDFSGLHVPLIQAIKGIGELLSRSQDKLANCLLHGLDEGAESASDVEVLELLLVYVDGSVDKLCNVF